jgi:hypothetical protein
MQMRSHKIFFTAMLAAMLCALGISSAFADYEPNDNYSSLVLSYRSTNFATPVCIGNDCHTGVSGPAGVFSHQVVPNLALGVSASYLKSNGSSSTLTSTGLSAFAEAIAGIGYRVDIGAVVAALSSSLELCATNPDSCTSAQDTGTDLGVFGKVFLNDMRSVSLGLSYDSISYQKSATQAVVVLSLVTVLEKHHRLACSADRTLDSGATRYRAGMASVIAICGFSDRAVTVFSA